ncbi:olfactory receptor 11L1-like [Spea bombifrons]|uniref:olfactory receptor 11L1-like n=1 Tax=Spea bombifrons TaxID=233779 RepID=UPI002349DBA2|nr:olfactory receptor 11L1-like [Spea bombifrons]
MFLLTRTQNQTSVEFFLLGFQLPRFRAPLFVALFLLYSATIMGNFLIIALVNFSRALRSPMYFFLGHLSSADIFLTSSIVPNMLFLILNEGGAISLAACLTQLQCIGCSMTIECLLLAVMSYDRLLAISRPLRYNAIMDHKLCRHLAAGPWFVGSAVALVVVGLVSRLEFCGPRLIDHFFCDVSPLLKLSCSDTFIVRTEVFILSSCFALLPFAFIISTYLCIFQVIFLISSSSGRRKAFSTCSSHLAAVCLYYGTLIGLYVVPSDISSFNMYKYMSLLYTLATPFFNPMIYSARNREIRRALLKTIHTVRGQARV